MFIVLMGVSGAGKTTIGRALAQTLGWTFYDADDFHPPANVAKMRQGIPLTDEDRWPWLEALHTLIAQCQQRGESAVLACSALKQAYRANLQRDNAAVRLVYLKGDYALIQQRLAQRHGHYMPAALLASQFETLEEPTDVLTIDVAAAPAAVVQAIRQGLAV